MATLSKATVKEILNTCEPPYSQGKTVEVDTYDYPGLPDELEAQINWFDELKNKQPDWDKLKILSESWVSCACGNQCSIIPRDSCGCPEDEELDELGRDFMYAINKQKAKESIQILHKIEHRSAILIKQIRKQQLKNK